MQGSASWERVAIEHPYLDRWYHTAIVRNGNAVTVYVDGIATIEGETTSAGDTGNTNGVSIGGWGNGKYLYGEIQEVSGRNRH